MTAALLEPRRSISEESDETTIVVPIAFTPGP
jgi:hypothetical protein